MACEAITNYLARNSSLLGPYFITRSPFAMNPWTKLVPQKPYPKGIGHDFRAFIAERAAPTSKPSWTSATSYSSGEDCGVCAESFTAIDVGHTTRTCSLTYAMFKSRMFCVEDTTPSWEANQQVRAIRDELGSYVAWVWQDRYCDDAFRWCKYKVVSDGSYTGNYTTSIATTYPAVQPTQILTRTLLQYWYYLLFRDGAGMGGVGMNGASPILPLYLGPEASDALFRQSDADRNDLRWSTDSNNDLLKIMHVNKVLHNFAHIVVPFPRRFTYAGGTFTQVVPFTAENKTILTGAEVSGAYDAAPYEEAMIPNRMLYEMLVPTPTTSHGSGTSFGNATYTGEFIWKNFDIESNVFRTQGRWYGRLRAASMPLHPEYGVSIVFRRCVPDIPALPTSCVYYGA